MERDLWGGFSDSGAFDDPVAQTLFNEAYFSPGSWDSDQISAIRDELANYLMDEYGVDFDAVFDWEEWREAYESA